MTVSKTPFQSEVSSEQLVPQAFAAATSGDRAARLREWLLDEPGEAQIQQVYRDMSHRDKGAAKVLKERLDDLKRAREQAQLIEDWAARAQQLLGAGRLNIADALAWQRDAAKAGAPLSREPLAGLKASLSDVVKRVEDLQHQVMVQREAAVLLAQRIEVQSTKPILEAQGHLASLQQDVQVWLAQAAAMTEDAMWASVDLKYPSMLEASRLQLQMVWSGFEEALQQALGALAQSDSALPSVPVWADEVRAQRGESMLTPATAEKPAKPKLDAAARQGLREAATAAVLQVLESVEKEVAEGHGKASSGAAAALRQVLKEHGRHLDTALDARVHQTLTAAGELEGWQRWRADQLRQELVSKAEALLGADKSPAMGGRKMQEALRQLREAWKQTDQGGLPNHALWKKFDAACNEAYKAVQVWLDQLKQESAAQKGLRLQLIEEVKAWTAEHAQDDDWRSQARAVHQFSERWRGAGHLSEKAYAELQPQWKAVIHAAAMRLEAAQKESTQRRHALIEEAKVLGAAPMLRIDAVKALQQRWQAEAQAVPLDRKTEQKLWEVFRKPIDEAFERKGNVRSQAEAALSARDRAVVDAAKALQAANASGDAGQIRAAMSALDAALKGQAQARVDVESASAAQAGAEPVAAEALSASEVPPPSETPEGAAPDTSVEPPPRTPRAVVAVRGDDRPGQKRTEPAADKAARRDGRPGERGARRDDTRGSWRDDHREDRGPRLGDAAFRAQRDAREHAELALRKLAAQAHGETLTKLMLAWKERQAEAMPAAQELGKAINASTRQTWIQALDRSADASSAQALLRLEMAAEVPTPAEHLDQRRALQLQLLTRRHDPSPAQTWTQDVAQVLASAHDEASARRLHNALKQLLRR